MAKKNRSVPQYGTVTRKGTLYYRTRILDADGKQVSLYAATCEELYEKQLAAKKQVEEIIFRRKHPTVAEYCEKWLLMQSAKVSSATMKGYTSDMRNYIIKPLGEDLTVSHDSKWTSEALFNLLDNAVKYTPAGGKISVSVVLWEVYVEIKVTDTGKGISESNQAAIFRRFYREEEVHEQQGVGIGLYLAREIVTWQGGYIKVISEPGKGSKFSIMLPTK